MKGFAVYKNGILYKTYVTIFGHFVIIEIILLYLVSLLLKNVNLSKLNSMESLEKILKESDYVVQNLKHLERIHAQWVSKLNETDWADRPMGYENQVSGISMQENAYSRETGRFLETLISEWIDSLDLSDANAILKLRDSLKTASKILAAKLKDLSEPTPEEPTLNL